MVAAGGSHERCLSLQAGEERRIVLEDKGSDWRDLSDKTGECWQRAVRNGAKNQVGRRRDIVRKRAGDQAEHERGTRLERGMGTGWMRTRYPTGGEREINLYRTRNKAVEELRINL